MPTETQGNLFLKLFKYVGTSDLFLKSESSITQSYSDVKEH